MTSFGLSSTLSSKIHKFQHLHTYMYLQIPDRARSCELISQGRLGLWFTMYINIDYGWNNLKVNMDVMWIMYVKTMCNLLLINLHKKIDILYLLPWNYLIIIHKLCNKFTDQQMEWHYMHTQLYRKWEPTPQPLSTKCVNSLISTWLITLAQTTPQVAWPLTSWSQRSKPSLLGNPTVMLVLVMTPTFYTSVVMHLNQGILHFQV